MEKTLKPLISWSYKIISFTILITFYFVSIFALPYIYNNSVTVLVAALVVPIAIAYLLGGFLYRHPFIFLFLWLPGLLILLLNIKLTIELVRHIYYTDPRLIIENIYDYFYIIVDKFNHLAYLFMIFPFVSMTVSFVLFVLTLIIYINSKMAHLIMTNKHINPASALFTIMQLYVSLILIMSIIYSGVEIGTHGHAFHGLIPETLPPVELVRRNFMYMAEQEKKKLEIQESGSIEKEDSNIEYEKLKKDIKDLNDSKPKELNYGERYKLENEYKEFLSQDEVQTVEDHLTYTSIPLLLELDSLYFSAVTTATVGYGDIYPKHPIAKIIIVFHIFLAQFIIIVLLGLIISGFNNKPPL